MGYTVSCVECGTLLSKDAQPPAEEPCPECGSTRRQFTPEDGQFTVRELPTDWSPERKIVGGAIAGLVVAVLQVALPDLEIPPGAEAGVAVLTAYLLPNKR